MEVKVKKCLMCQKPIPYAHGNALRCGNERRKQGCAYKNYLIRNKRWKKDTKYHKTPHRLMKQRQYDRTRYLKEKGFTNLLTK